MRFLVDEMAGSSVAQWLREQGHTVFSVFDEARGIDDDEVMRRALVGDFILITNDKGFGAKIYRDQYRHKGVVLLRLEDERPPAKMAALGRLLARYADRLPGSFVVVTESRVRFRRS